MADRYVLLGLGAARAGWFRTIAQWSTSAMLPAEFIRCVSVEELRVRLTSNRAFSAVVIDACLPGLDRDLIALAAGRGVAVLVVDDERRRDWPDLGAAAVLATRFGRDELLEVLAATSAPVGAPATQAVTTDAVTTRPPGSLIAVTGPGGTGASSLAIALAQGLADDGHGERRRNRQRRRRGVAGASRRSVLLVDLCRAADQAMLHDARVVVPSIQEIVEAHRTAVPPPAAVLEQTFTVSERGYRLVLGLRRPRHWVGIRPLALDSALDSLQRLASCLVADVDADLEGEQETGSRDVEDRNLLARTTLGRADLVLVVGEPSMKGTFAAVRTIAEVIDFGVASERVLPVVNRAPQSPRVRAEVTRTLGELALAGLGPAADGLASPIFLPDRAVGDALRDGVALPSSLSRPLASAATALLRQVGPLVRSSRAPEAERVVPGSWSLSSVEEEIDP